MQRREFLAMAGAAAASCGFSVARAHEAAGGDPIYASPELAQRAPRERFAYVTAIRPSQQQRPDYLATIDLDPRSSTYSQVVHRLEMPQVGDELHHFGWNACSSCHAAHATPRAFLVLPGLRSSRIHIVEMANPRAPRLKKVIEPEEIARRTNLSAPHTVHCLPDGQVMISMLGDAQGNGPGGFLLLDANFEIVGRWEKNAPGMRFNYDFWYQPRQNVMVSSEWAAPNTFAPGFDLADVQAGKYGSQIHFWDWKQRAIRQSIDLGPGGLIPLEVRFHHRPDSDQGFVGAALASKIWHWRRQGERFVAAPVIEVQSVEAPGWDIPVPGLITDLVLSLDDRWLYFSNWLHGDLRQYDMRDPANPRLTGQLWLGGVLGKGAPLAGKPRTGGPQMLQLSLDGRRLYVTSSLYSTWDDKFYPTLAEQGSYLAQVDCDTERGGLMLAENFFVDFGAEPGGAARAHEMRLSGGDSTSDIWD